IVCMKLYTVIIASP
ncbi:kinase domain protein, partial [Chlamydia psittaci 84-8471/1]